jgi:hypothetical protein
MTLAPPTVQATSLYFHEGPSNNEYHAAIEPKGGSYIVTFAYYRHGGNLTVGTKTPAPLPLEAATKVFAKLIASKLAKGYQASFPCNPLAVT